MLGEKAWPSHLLRDETLWKGPTSFLDVIAKGHSHRFLEHVLRGVCQGQRGFYTQSVSAAPRHASCCQSPGRATAPLQRGSQELGDAEVILADWLRWLYVAQGPRSACTPLRPTGQGSWETTPAVRLCKGRSPGSAPQQLRKDRQVAFTSLWSPGVRSTIPFWGCA